MPEGKRLEKTSGKNCGNILGGSMSRKAEKCAKEQRTVFVSAVCDRDFGRRIASGIFVSFGNSRKSHPAGERYHCIRNALGKNSEAGERLTVFLQEKDVALPALKDDAYGPETEGP